MTTIKYAASGEQRKKLVNALSEILECESKYLKAPSYGYEVVSCIVNRTEDIEFPDDMAEEEIEAIVKKLTWHGFERILDEPAEEIDGTPVSEESSLEEEFILEADNSTEEIVADTTETDIDDSEDVLANTITSEIDTTEDSVIFNETPEELAEEPEASTLPEGSFESAEATKEATGEPSEETSIPEATEPKKIVIELPNSYLNEAELGRVRAIVASKATVLKKALETDDLSVERKKEDKICFQWFTNHGIDGEAKAYMQLISGIAKRAKMLTRVTATENVSDNDKFTMRLFLISLDFKGEEYKFARKFLLRNLSGNSSWRTEDAKARHDARKVQQEIKAPEVTIGQSSEGGEDHAELPE